MTGKDDIMNISIRQHVISNFKDSDTKDIEESIESSVNDKDEVTLPGLGVFFELLWENSSLDERNQILEILKNSIKK